jgi:hypothetical protein
LVSSIKCNGWTEGLDFLGHEPNRICTGNDTLLGGGSGDGLTGAQGVATPLQAALAHLWFVTVHPLEDGNGRIARAIADLALARSEGSPQRFYSMSAQIRTERNAYYDQLEQTQKGETDVTEWILWFLACLGRAIHGADGVLAAVVANRLIANPLDGNHFNRLPGYNAANWRAVFDVFQSGHTAFSPHSANRENRHLPYRSKNSSAKRLKAQWIRTFGR